MIFKAVSEVHAGKESASDFRLANQYEGLKMEGRVACKSTGFFVCYRVRGVDSRLAPSKGKWKWKWEWRVVKAFTTCGSAQLRTAAAPNPSTTPRSLEHAVLLTFQVCLSLWQTHTGLLVHLRVLPISRKQAYWPPANSRVANSTK